MNIEQMRFSGLCLNKCVKNLVKNHVWWMIFSAQPTNVELSSIACPGQNDSKNVC